jgi:hypothetical protein
MARLRTVFELGDGVSVFVAEGLDGLLVARDVAAEANAIALLVTIAGLEIGDLQPDFDAIAESEPVEMKGEGIRVEGEDVFGLCGPRVHASGLL